MSENTKSKVPATGEALAAPAEPTRPLFVKPAYESCRVDGDWEIGVVMPGVKRKDISVSLEKDELTIVGRRSDSVPESWRPLYEERHKADYRLRLQLNFEADPDRITASIEDGVLTLRLPEHEAAKPKQIEVK